MKTLLLSLFIVSIAYGEDTIPKFSPNPILNKILTKRWIDSLHTAYVNMDSLQRATFYKQRRNLAKKK
jgi:hypothetical protein